MLVDYCSCVYEIGISLYSVYYCRYIQRNKCTFSTVLTFLLFLFGLNLKGQGHEIRIGWKWYGWKGLIENCHWILVLIFLSVPSIFYSSFKFLTFEPHLSFQKLREDLSVLLKSVLICSWSFSKANRELT